MIIFLVLVAIIWIVSKKSEKIRFWKEKLIQQPFNYYLLIGLLVIGFIFRLDYSDRFGCIVFTEPIFEFKNILFSAISITLVLLSLFFQKRKVKLTLIFCELLFWIFKLSFFKGGYVVNYLGTADPIISLFDTTTLALRLFIINTLLKTSTNQVYILICTLIVMSMKIYFFPLPHSFYVAERKYQLESENTKNFLTKGEWIEIKDTTEKIRIVFLPESVIIYNLQNKDSLFFNNISWQIKRVFLEFWGNSKHDDCIFEYQENGKDTLNVYFRYNDEDYETQMTRKR
jgi:hypothetical protein